ncbi:hypothetical protein AQUCO_03700344v1 [Aquilegia coerulea]|uniref:Protein kinase domain-containing protein n=1 Tax=Aquilegia coerulea TaxID=218851 RepID=A0A2G5CUT0_AQUCA|nr:hypothetical protein AQUCO_03700344v1 [Aquilegia coerulea]
MTVLLHIKRTPPHLLFNTISPSPAPNYINPTRGGGGGGGGGDQEENTTNINTTNRSISISIKLIVILSSLLFVFIVTTTVMGFFTFLRFIRRGKSTTSRRNKILSNRRVEDAEEVPLPLPDDQLTDNSRSKSEDNFSLITRPSTSRSSTSVIRRFSWEEIISLSANFSTVIDQGGFSTVYLVHFPNSSCHCWGAIKIHENSERLNRNFRQELDILLHLGHHENIVQLLGYCDEQDEKGGRGGALLFEYVPSGNLQEKLHGKAAVRMPWKSRMWIAFQLARAIQYLHHKCTLPIVHGDIKASNILLDDQLNCKLCDFGSAKMGFSATLLPSSSTSLSLMGSPGYIDPHYLRTGIASKKNDVYSFGVILLELITGMEAFCSAKEQLLTTIAGPLLRGGREDKVDLRPLMATEDLSHSEEEEVMIMASISALCLTQQPSHRPSMADIVTTMTNKTSSIYSFLTTEKNHHHQP